MSLISDVEKIFCLRGLYQDFSSKVFLTRSTENFRRGTLLCFTKILVSKNLMEKRGEEEDGGSIKIFPQIFLSQCRNRLLGIPLVCHYFRVSKNFILEMAMPRFSVEIFCLALSKNFVGEPSVFHKSSGIEKKLWKRGGGGGREYQVFPSIFSCLSAKKIRGGTL